MQHDLTKLAALMRHAHANGIAMRLPAMTVRELGILARLLDSPASQPARVLH